MSKWGWPFCGLRVAMDLCLGGPACSCLPCLPQPLPQDPWSDPGPATVECGPIREPSLQDKGCELKPGWQRALRLFSGNSLFLASCRAWATSTPRESCTRTSSQRMSSTTMAKWSSRTLDSSAFLGCCRLAGERRWEHPESFLTDDGQEVGS